MVKATIAGVITVLMLAACGSSSSKTVTFHAPTPAAVPLLACGTDIGADFSAQMWIAQLVKDQKSQNRALQENWVNPTGTVTSQGNDLQTAARLLAPGRHDHLGTRYIVNGDTPLGADAQAFSSDANGFLEDESGGLASGWPTEYRAVQVDILNLAKDCGLPHKGIYTRGFIP
jgi:hypothetical protein